MRGLLVKLPVIDFVGVSEILAAWILGVLGIIISFGFGKIGISFFLRRLIYMNLVFYL